jgi:PPOX class probable F420-dependent enzyme
VDEPTLDTAARALLAEARRATLTTIDARDGRPRSVPVCYALVSDAIWSPLDEKPKRGDDPTALRRVRNLQADERATLLVDRWSEDWTRLAFLELDLRGALVEPGAPDHVTAVAALRTRYPQYAGHRLEERPMLRFRVVGVVAWASRSDAG